MPNLKPAQVIALSFLAAIAIGAALLSLPIAAANGVRLPVVDALFTATSAVCVTGLIVRDTGTFFSPFGRWVILGLFQVGALGIMTFSTLFAILLGRKLTIRDNLVIQGALDHHKIEGISGLIKCILTMALSIELIGALLLYARTRDPFSSLFHAVSAFCNAGFSVYKESFIGFAADGYVNFVIVSLIILGGLGFVVLLDGSKLRLWGRDKANKLSKISLQAKIAVFASAALIIIGTLALLLFENNGIYASSGLKEKLLTSLFQSATARTAGFNTVNISMLSTPSLLTLIILMFIGASPGSTGGGIKTVTIGIILGCLWSAARGKSRFTIFKRTVPVEIFHKAMIILILGLAWVAFSSITLSFIEKSNLGHMSDYFIRILFEVVSAFGTVGLSTGITPDLTLWGKALIIVTMYVGRIGPLTLALTLIRGGREAAYKYPEERVMVG
ncbi:MAG: hypothetical protein AUJ75_03485 [Candidatus Omnitrophica bacterium CG1_02_49_10]|nr:MAG: hypothetical protein AUJ75_03485 [Candidatus Omnitrophica bacterium CG1_02_49_10]